MKLILFRFSVVIAFILMVVSCGRNEQSSADSKSGKSSAASTNKKNKPEKLADPNQAANALFVEASTLFDNYEKLKTSPDEAFPIIEKAIHNLRKIKKEYPQSDMAVKLVQGQAIIGGKPFDLALGEEAFALLDSRYKVRRQAKINPSVFLHYVEGIGSMLQHGGRVGLGFNQIMGSKTNKNWVSVREMQLLLQAFSAPKRSPFAKEVPDKRELFKAEILAQDGNATSPKEDSLSLAAKGKQIEAMKAFNHEAAHLFGWVTFAKEAEVGLSIEGTFEILVTPKNGEPLPFYLKGGLPVCLQGSRHGISWICLQSEDNAIPTIQLFIRIRRIAETLAVAGSKQDALKVLGEALKEAEKLGTKTPTFQVARDLSKSLLNDLKQDGKTGEKQESLPKNDKESDKNFSILVKSIVLAQLSVALAEIGDKVQAKKVLQQALTVAGNVEAGYRMYSIAYIACALHEASDKAWLRDLSKEMDDLVRGAVKAGKPRQLVVLLPQDPGKLIAEVLTQMGALAGVKAYQSVLSIEAINQEVKKNPGLAEFLLQRSAMFKATLREMNLILSGDNWPILLWLWMWPESEARKAALVAEIKKGKVSRAIQRVVVEGSGNKEVKALKESMTELRNLPDQDKNLQLWKRAGFALALSGDNAAAYDVITSGLVGHGKHRLELIYWIARSIAEEKLTCKKAFTPKDKAIAEQIVNWLSRHTHPLE